MAGDPSNNGLGDDAAHPPAPGARGLPSGPGRGGGTPAVAVLRRLLRPHRLVAGGDDDRAHLALDDLLAHVVVDRPRPAGLEAALAGENAGRAALGLRGGV